MGIRENKNVCRNFRFKMVSKGFLQAKSISRIRFAIRVILGELWAVKVVTNTSAGSFTCLVDKSA